MAMAEIYFKGGSVVRFRCTKLTVRFFRRQLSELAWEGAVDPPLHIDFLEVAAVRFVS